MSHIVYLFRCPIHGEETQVFCFRAFDERNKHLWGKLETKFEEMKWDEGELEKYIQSILG